VLEDERVQAALLGHRGRHPTVLLEHADAADAVLAGLASLQEPVDHHSLVRAVEPADAEVDDAGGDAVAVVGGHGDTARGDLVEGLRGQADGHRYSFVRWRIRGR
jgi:hypothetical protein